MARPFLTLSLRLALVLFVLFSPGCASISRWVKWTPRKEAPSGPQLSASAVGVTASPAPRPAAPAAAPAVTAAPAPAVSAPPPATVRPAALPTAGPAFTTALGDKAPYRLRIGDPIIIYLRGIMPRDDEIEEIVDERGAVTLPYIDDVAALGKTVSELEREIQRTYIQRQIYRTVTVNVVMPSQSFFVQGEVRQPQRYPLITGMTVLQGIASAGGYTEFADPKRVILTRGGKIRELNMREVERDPLKDIMIESGDVIRVPRSIF